MTETARGSCVCGAVHYEVTAPYGRFQYCYCSRCRKRSGAASVASLFVKADQLTWLEGHEHVRQFDLPTAEYWCSAFCTRCGSSVPWLFRNGAMYSVPAGGLDDDIGVTPSRNIFFASRAGWYVHPHDLETFDGVPQRAHPAQG